MAPIDIPDVLSAREAEEAARALLARAEVLALSELSYAVLEAFGPASRTVLGARLAGDGWDISHAYDRHGRLVHGERIAAINRELGPVVEIVTRPLRRRVASYEIPDFDGVDLRLSDDGDVTLSPVPVYDD